VTSRRRPAALVAGLVVAALAAGVLAGCADDGNDAAYQVRRAADLAAERREVAAGEPAPSEPAPSEPAPGTTAPPVEPTGVVVPVIALDNTFRPEVVEISVGDQVVWENRGLNEHDLLYVETGEWGVEAAFFQPGDVYSRIFTEPGEYDYYCTIHGTAEIGMIGTVIVTG
jgi:plastocyanin